jgi:hypothetical protein
MVASSKVDTELLPTENQTPVGPWPANIDGVLLALGSVERNLASELSASDPAVQQVLKWMRHQGQNGIDTPVLQVTTPDERGNFVWYAPSRAVLHVRELLADRARSDLRSHAANNYFGEGFTTTAWWLSRCAVNDEDLILAAAALRVAGQDEYEELLRAGVVKKKGLSDRLAEALRSLRPHGPSVVVAAVAATRRPGGGAARGLIVQYQGT